MTLTPRDRKILLLGAAVLAVLLGGRFVLLPLIDHWGSLRDTIGRRDAVLSELDAMRKRRDALMGRLEGVGGAAIRQPLESIDATHVRFHETVQDLLSKSAVGYTSIELQGVRSLRDVPGTCLLSLQVQGQCDLAALSRCLERVRESERLVIVDRLHVRGPNPKKLAVTLVLSAPAQERPR